MDVVDREVVFGWLVLALDAMLPFCRYCGEFSGYQWLCCWGGVGEASTGSFKEPEKV
jgi:hypothetical protein